MARLSCLLGVIWAICATPAVMGENLIVKNASFEDSILPTGESTLNGEGLDHWTSESGSGVGLWNVSDLTYFPGGAPDGVNVAYSYGPAISQILSDVVVEEYTFKLTVKVGNSPCCVFPGYGVQLRANGVVLAEDANYIPVPAGNFETVVVSYTSPPGDSNAGNPLEIRLLSMGPEVTFDGVSVTATADAHPEWALLNINSATSLWSTSMAYDSTRDVTVMFGGRDGDPVADTSEYDGTSWQSVNTANTPPARFWHSMVYDSNRQRIVLFGGGDPDRAIYFNDTWEYDGTNWQQISTDHSPPEMLVKTMVFDSTRNRTVLFGGEGPGIEYDDTWEYNGSDWTQIVTPASPPAPGALAAMAYHASRERTVLTFKDNTLHLATWEYDGSTWAKVDTTTAPFGRWGHSMVYDISSHHLVLFGGYAPDYASGSAMNDTWEYDGSDWTQIVTPHSPGPADQHAMAFHAAAGRAIVLRWGETWAYTRPEVFTSSFEGDGSSDTPIIISSSPPSPADDNDPEIIGSARAGTTVNLYSDNTCSTLLASGAADDFNTTGITIHVSDNSETTVYATATDDIGTVSPCSSSFVTYTEGDCNIGGTWAAEARDCTSSDCELFEEGRYRSWDGRIWCRALITNEHDNWTVAVPPGTTTFDFWVDWGAWDLNGCGDGVTSISIPVCGLNETIYRDGVEQRLRCDVTGQGSFVIEKEAVACEYAIIGNPHFY